MPKIVVVPGIGGSSLNVNTPVGWVTVYGSTIPQIAGNLITGLAESLQLDPNGNVVGEIEAVDVLPPYRTFIQLLGQYNSNNYAIRSGPYNWMLGPVDVAYELLSGVVEPTVFVAHSYGCMAIPKVYDLLRQYGHADWFAGAVLLGAPCSWAYGNYNTFRTLNRDGSSYQLAAAGITLNRGIITLITSGLLTQLFGDPDPLSALDAMIGSWTSTAALMPAVPQYSAATLMENLANQHLTDQWLARGRAQKTACLRGLTLPRGLFYQIQGTGIQTASGWTPQGGLSYGSDGDDTVNWSERLFPDNDLQLTNVGHIDMLSNQDIAQTIMSLINQNIFIRPTATLPTTSSGAAPAPAAVVMDQGNFVMPALDLSNGDNLIFQAELGEGPDNLLINSPFISHILTRIDP